MKKAAIAYFALAELSKVMIAEGRTLEADQLNVCVDGLPHDSLVRFYDIMEEAVAKVQTVSKVKA